MPASHTPTAAYYSPHDESAAAALLDAAKHLLPQTALQLIEALGAARALALISRYKGQRIWIPLSVRDHAHQLRDDALMRLLGQAAYRALCLRFGGNGLLIPSCSQALYELRNVQILAAYQQGASVNALAQAHQTSARTIERILAKPCSLAHESAAAQALARQAAQGDLF